MIAPSGTTQRMSGRSISRSLAGVAGTQRFEENRGHAVCSLRWIPFRLLLRLFGPAPQRGQPGLLGTRRPGGDSSVRSLRTPLQTEAAPGLPVVKDGVAPPAPAFLILPARIGAEPELPRGPGKPRAVPARPARLWAGTWKRDAFANTPSNPPAGRSKSRKLCCQTSQAGGLAAPCEPNAEAPSIPTARQPRSVSAIRSRPVRSRDPERCREERLSTRRSARPDSGNVVVAGAFPETPGHASRKSQRGARGLLDFPFRGAAAWPRDASRPGGKRAFCRATGSPNGIYLPDATAMLLLENNPAGRRGRSDTQRAQSAPSGEPAAQPPGRSRQRWGRADIDSGRRLPAGIEHRLPRTELRGQSIRARLPGGSSLPGFAGAALDAVIVDRRLRIGGYALG